MPNASTMDLADSDSGSMGMRKPRILVAYHTVEGQSEKIASFIAQTLRQNGADSNAIAVACVPTELDDFDGVIVGGSIHKGRHHADLVDFVQRHREALARVPAAFFSVSLTAVNSDAKSRQSLDRIVDSFFEKSGWQRPEQVALFAGSLAYSRYGFFTRRLMKWIAGRQGGSTDTSKDVEYTDWSAVADFARAVLVRASHTAGPESVAVPAHPRVSRTRVSGRR